MMMKKKEKNRKKEMAQEGTTQKKVPHMGEKRK
jgi:hypothetical protein